MKNEISDTKSKSPEYWFPAKTHGWGWGLPSSWQGWIVFLLFIAICCGSEWLGGGSLAITIAIIVFAAAVLTAIAFWKGEPPRWRWGKETPARSYESTNKT